MFVLTWDIVLVLFLRDCWFGGMIRLIKLVEGPVMREEKRVCYMVVVLHGRVKGEDMR